MLFSVYSSSVLSDLLWLYAVGYSPEDRWGLVKVSEQGRFQSDLDTHQLDLKGTV